jgi:hypothetical protein
MTIATWSVKYFADEFAAFQCLGQRTSIGSSYTDIVKKCMEKQRLTSAWFRILLSSKNAVSVYTNDNIAPISIRHYIMSTSEGENSLKIKKTKLKLPSKEQQFLLIYSAVMSIEKKNYSKI